MIASAMKGCPFGPSAWVHAFQQPLRISDIVVRLRVISPFVRDSKPGIRPGSMFYVIGVQTEENTDKETGIRKWMRNERTPNHITHQLLRVTTDIKEFELCIRNELTKCPMRGNPNSMTMLEELLPQGEVRLDVP